jgi:G2/mitotic-specific cyclin 1/2
MREWALDRWQEQTQVNLSKELARLKAEIKIQREAEEALLHDREDEEDGVENYNLLTELRAR